MQGYETYRCTPEGGTKHFWKFEENAPDRVCRVNNEPPLMNWTFFGQNVNLMIHDPSCDNVLIMWQAPALLLFFNFQTVYKYLLFTCYRFQWNIYGLKLVPGANFLASSIILFSISEGNEWLSLQVVYFRNFNGTYTRHIYQGKCGWKRAYPFMKTENRIPGLDILFDISLLSFGVGLRDPLLAHSWKPVHLWSME